MCRKIVLFLILCSLACPYVFAQQPSPKTDSTKLYRDIETFSSKRKSTHFLYKLFFRPVAITAEPLPANIQIIPPVKTYVAFEGKIIRQINITTLDPFGYSSTDTAAVAQNVLDKAGNSLHMKTQRITILNLLLIHKYQLFDSLLVKESERLVRAQKYVHEVVFSISSSGTHPDSVDIDIRELDTWSIIPDGGASTADFNVSITEKNFLGFGHEVKSTYARNFYNSVSAFTANYFIPNIRNTYVSSNVHYGVDSYHNFNKSVTIDRPFFSPFAKWAAGVSVAALFRHDSLKTVELVNVPYNVSLVSQDYWAGKAQGIFKGNTEEARVTRLILALRYLHTSYLEKPPDIYDPLQNYADEDFYLTSIGISTRKYIQDRYVFNFGLVEDVPVGKVYELTAGYQVRNNSERLYLGARYSVGDYIDWGYLSWNLEYGSFYRSSQPEQGVLAAGVNYSTDLFGIGSWKFRQFIKTQLTMGLNRFSSEAITINNENGIRGFNSITLPGTEKLVVTLQTQSYCPWSLLGFHFGPYIIYSVGMLGNETTGFAKSRVYSEFAVGLLIKNLYLVFDYFQVSISFYPTIPGQGTNIFKLNPNSTTDFGFRDFIIGKPAPVAYQ